LPEGVDSSILKAVAGEVAMADKDRAAERLASAHRDAEPEIVEIVRIIGDEEDRPTEPIKLLEVNPATSPSGVVPVAFTADPPDVPYPSVVVEVTEGEFAEIQRARLPLPHGWRLGPTLFRRAA
jgi:hypothetical protein